MPNVAYGMNMLVENVRGIKIPNAGHSIQGEQPQFLINQLSNFFGQDTTKIELRCKIRRSKLSSADPKDQICMD